MFYNCERCGRDTLNKVNVHSTKLVGGVSTALCSRCLTEWDEAYKAHAAHERVEANLLQQNMMNARAAAGRAPEESEMAALMTEARATDAIYHEFGKEFINTKPDWANAV